MIKTAVILASGLGTRLQSYLRGKPKFLLDIYGRSIITYPIHVLSKIGVKVFIITLPRGWRQAFKESVERNYVDLTFILVENDEIERGNGYSFYLTQDFVQDELFLLSMCDHIYVPGLVEKLISNSIRYLDKAIAFVAGDLSPKYIDINEATKIQVDDDDYLIEIGKRIEHFKYVDTGVFLLKRDLLKVAGRIVYEKKIIEFPDVLSAAVILGFKVKVVDVSSNVWTEIDTLSDLKSILEGERHKVIEEVTKILM